MIPFIIFLTIVITIFYTLAFVSSYIIVEIFPEIKKYKIKIFIIFLTLVSFFIFSLILWRFTDNLFWFFYKIWAFSLGFLYLSLLILVPSFIFKKIYKKDFSLYVKSFILICILGLNIFWLYNWFSTKVVEYEIKTEKNTNLKWKTLILFADNHYWNIFNEKDAEKLVKKINSIKWDLVLIPWDLFDWPRIDFEKIAKILEKINKPVFFAAWNHEEYWDTKAILWALLKTDFYVLNNETVDFDWIKISWVTYSENHNKENFEKNLKNISPENNTFNILIKHEPKFIDIAEKYNYDLAVYWHTHKWQMWPFSIITEKIYGKYFYWLNEENWKYAITTSWVWGWWPPQRFWSRSEIVIIKII